MIEYLRQLETLQTTNLSQRINDVLLLEPWDCGKLRPRARLIHLLLLETLTYFYPDEIFAALKEEGFPDD